MPVFLNPGGNSTIMFPITRAIITVLFTETATAIVTGPCADSTKTSGMWSTTAVQTGRTTHSNAETKNGGKRTSASKTEKKTVSGATSPKEGLNLHVRPNQ